MDYEQNLSSLHNGSLRFETEYEQDLSPLHNGILRGNASELQAILETSPSFDTRSRSMSPLQSAGHGGHYDLIEVLLSHNAPVNAAPGEFGCAMQACITSNTLEGYPDRIGVKVDDEYASKKEAAQQQAVALLISHEANPNLYGGEFGSALAAAAAFGCTSIVGLLLENGADPNSPGGRMGTALQAACAHGELPIGWSISLADVGEYSIIQDGLLEAGARVNDVGGVFGTALQGAAACGDEDAVERLLSQGADVNIQAGKFGSALAAAAGQGHMKIVERLLNAGAKIGTNGEDHPQDNWASWKEEPVTSLFMKYSAALPSVKTQLENRTTRRFSGALQWAVGNERLEIAEYLRERLISDFKSRTESK